MPVYFLHAEFDLRNPVDGDAPDRDCVHTVGGPKPLPPQVIHEDGDGGGGDSDGAADDDGDDDVVDDDADYDGDADDGGGGDSDGVVDVADVDAGGRSGGYVFNCLIGIKPVACAIVATGSSANTVGELHLLEEIKL